MNLTLRRLLYTSFILTFVIVALALLFFLQGFRFNFTERRIERTGAIAAESQPEQVTVIVNGNIQREQTPTSIQSLYPGDYAVVMSAPGWQTWRKNLEVKPSQVTFTGLVRLWPPPQSGERIVGALNTTNLLSPSGESLVYYSNTGLSSSLWLLNLTTGRTGLIVRSASPVTEVSWAPSSQEILIQQNVGGRLVLKMYDLEERSLTDVTLPPGLQPRLVRWGDDEGTLLIATSDELYQFGRRLKTLKLLWREQLKDFRAHDGLVFGLAQATGGSLSLKILNRANLQLIPLQAQPILSTSVAFLQAKRKWLPMFDEDRHVLYLLHSPLTALEPIRKLPEVTAIDWDAAGERVLLTNNFEMWEYEIDAAKLNLILRVSSMLTQARLTGNEPYLIYASNGEVWALELDTRGEQQRWLLASYPERVTDLFLDERLNSLTVKTISAFYRLRLDQPILSLAEPSAD